MLTYIAVGLLLVVCVPHPVHLFKLHTHDHPAEDRYHIYELYMENAPDVDRETIEMAVRVAMDQWNNVPYNRIELALGITHDRDVTCQKDNPYIYSICFGWVDAYSPARTEWREGAGDVQLSSMHMFNIQTMYNSLLHEFGHINLLDHSQYYNTVMGSGMAYIPGVNAFVVETTFMSLTLDDYNGVIYRYTNYIYDMYGGVHGPYHVTPDSYDNLQDSAVFRAASNSPDQGVNAVSYNRFSTHHDN